MKLRLFFFAAYDDELAFLVVQGPSKCVQFGITSSFQQMTLEKQPRYFGKCTPLASFTRYGSLMHVRYDFSYLFAFYVRLDQGA